VRVPADVRLADIVSENHKDVWLLSLGVCIDDCQSTQQQGQAEGNNGIPHRESPVQSQLLQHGNHEELLSSQTSNTGRIEKPKIRQPFMMAGSFLLTGRVALDIHKGELTPNVPMT
jgi:hypothetical protein